MTEALTIIGTIALFIGGTVVAIILAMLLVSVARHLIMKWRNRDD